MARDGPGSVEVVDAANDNVLAVSHAHHYVSGFIFNGNLAEQHTILVGEGGDYSHFFAKLAIYLTQVAPTCCGPGLRQTRGAHRRAVVFGDQATALHPKTA